VSTARGADRAPLARSVLDREQVRRLHWGQDTPMALGTLPGAYASSDAGNGIGYSYLSIRGFPQRRISVTVNGVPLNDPESHEVYWIDHPDLLASASEVQVTRGVGSAMYGAAALGGAVNIETSPFSGLPRTAVHVAGGSFDTRRLMLEMDSGHLAGGWDLFGRYSRIETEGYRDQSWSKLWSYSLSARRTTGSQSFRVNLYGGPEETHLSYLGVPPPALMGGLTGDADRDRRVNPLAYPGEQDRFFEPHYELIHAWAPSDRLRLTQTMFWFDGRGSYDEQRFGRSLADFRLSPWATSDSTLLPRDYYARDGTGALVTDGSGRYTVERFDLVRRREVTNRHAGWIPRVRMLHAGGALTVGGEVRWHDGRHVGTVRSGNGLPPGTAPDARYYDYRPRTLAAGLFAREEWDVAPAWRVTADLAWRHQSYFMRDDRFDGIRFDQPYDFALPRLGVSWLPREGLSAFASWAWASREPAFRDLYDAEGAGSVPLYAVVDVARGVYEDPLVKPEKVHHVELGGSWAGAEGTLGANLFRMDFRDELVFAGQFDTDLGYPILGNAARSVHQGIELAARTQRALGAGVRVDVHGNATLSDNHFVRYREQYGPTPADEVRYDGNPIGFFPATLANAGAELHWRGATLAADVQHAGRIFVDNTGSDAASIAPRTVLNLRGAVARPIGTARAEFALRLFNAFDARYATGGYMDYDAAGALVPHVTPAATRHWLAELRVEF
jgi:iron complex outermembrane receptor protein